MVETYSLLVVVNNDGGDIYILVVVVNNDGGDI